jgi:nickel transport system substrate-binding protein
MVAGMCLSAHADYMAQIGLPMKKELDANIAAVLETTGARERQALYADILTVLHTQAVYMPLYYISLLEVHRAGELKSVIFATDKFRIPFEEIALE